MAYLPPHVSVTEVLTRASQNLANSQLLPVFIGSLNQVVSNASIALTYPVTSTTIAYPNLKIGAIVDTTTVNLTINNAIVKIIADRPVTGVFTAGSTTITDTGAFTSAQIGDMIVIPSNGGTYYIASLPDSDHAILTAPISYVPTTGDYSIERTYSSIMANIGTPTFASTNFTITQLVYNGMTIIGGNATISYVALRKDLTGFYSVSNIGQLLIDMDVTPQSNIGFYLGQIAQAANGGGSILAYITSDNLLTSFETAYSDLSARNDVYFIVPISTDPTICGAAASHSIAMSIPDIAYFRMAIINTPIVLSKDLVSNQTFTHA